MPTAEILSQGDEVVTGQIADTNAAWLSERLTDLGFSVVRHTAVGDRLGDIRDLLAAAATRAEVCVSTGGLGPTDDDLTARAAAEAFGRPLVFDPEAMAQIEAMYARFGRVMPEVNRRQAWLPAGARRLDNAWGTAPGFALEQPSDPGAGDSPAPRASLFFLPGVPREMRAMFEARVLPVLGERFSLRPGRLVTLRTTGVGESDLQERIGPFDEPDATLGYRTRLPENHVKLRFSPEAPSSRVVELSARIAAAIGSPLFTVEGLPPDTAALPGVDTGGGELAEVVGRALSAQGATLAIAESCTGGRVAAMCTAVPGASAWLVEALVTYADAAKVRRLGVSAATLAAHGAVSEPVAHEMARGARATASATFGLGITGIAGPGGGSDEKPVGTVHVALATPDSVHHRLLRLLSPRAAQAARGGDRERIQRLAAAGALDLLRRHLQNLL